MKLKTNLGLAGCLFRTSPLGSRFGSFLCRIQNEARNMKLQTPLEDRSVRDQSPFAEIYTHAEQNITVASWNVNKAGRAYEIPKTGFSLQGVSVAICLLVLKVIGCTGFYLRISEQVTEYKCTNQFFICFKYLKTCILLPNQNDAFLCSAMSDNTPWKYIAN